MQKSSFFSKTNIYGHKGNKKLFCIKLVILNFVLMKAKKYVPVQVRKLPHLASITVISTVISNCYCYKLNKRCKNSCPDNYHPGNKFPKQ